MTEEPQTVKQEMADRPGRVDVGANIEIHINLASMTIGDLETLEAPKTQREMIDTLQRLIVGADVRRMPITMLPVISRAIVAEIQTLREAKN